MEIIHMHTPADGCRYKKLRKLKIRVVFFIFAALRFYEEIPPQVPVLYSPGS